MQSPTEYPLLQLPQFYTAFFYLLLTGALLLLLSRNGKEHTIILHVHSLLNDFHYSCTVYNMNINTIYA